MSARVVPSPMLARTAPGIVTSSPHSASWSSRAVWALADTEQVGDERMGAKRSRAHGDPAVGQMGPELVGRPALGRERCDADSIGRVRPLMELRHAADRVEPVPERGARSRSCSATNVHPVGRERVAGRAERDGTEQVGRAGLVPSRRLGPGDALERDDPDGTATVQERRSVREPVRRRDEHPGAERRIDLVPREGEEVGLELVEVDPAVRCELRGVDEDERASRVGETGDLGDRRHLAGDVRGAGDRDEGERIAGPLGLLERVCRCRRGRRRPSS